MTRIVVVEDDALVAKYLRYILEQEGRYDAMVTESGDEVLTLAHDPITGAILVDVSLRHTLLHGRYVDGLELSRAIKTDRMSARVPVILTTAHTMAGDRERFLRESLADGFIGKPIKDSREVLALIADLIDRCAER